MNRHLQYNFYDLSKLDISHPTLAQIIADAARSGRFGETADYCPYGTSRDPFIRACRIAWRTAFRNIRNKKPLERAARGPRPSGLTLVAEATSPSKGIFS